MRKLLGVVLLLASLLLTWSAGSELLRIHRIVVGVMHDRDQFDADEPARGGIYDSLRGAGDAASNFLIERIREQEHTEEAKLAGAGVLLLGGILLLRKRHVRF